MANLGPRSYLPALWLDIYSELVSTGQYRYYCSDAWFKAVTLESGTLHGVNASGFET